MPTKAKSERCLNFIVNDTKTPRDLYMWLFEHNIMNSDVFRYKLITTKGVILNPQLTFVFQRVGPHDTIYLVDPYNSTPDKKQPSTNLPPSKQLRPSYKPNRPKLM